MSLPEWLLTLLEVLPPLHPSSSLLTDLLSLSTTLTLLTIASGGPFIADQFSQVLMCVLLCPGHSESFSTQDAITLAHRLCLLLTKMTVSKQTLLTVKVNNGYPHSRTS